MTKAERNPKTEIRRTESDPVVAGPNGEIRKRGQRVWSRGPIVPSRKLDSIELLRGGGVDWGAKTEVSAAVEKIRGEHNPLDSRGGDVGGGPYIIGAAWRTPRAA